MGEDAVFGLFYIILSSLGHVKYGPFQKAPSTCVKSFVLIMMEIYIGEGEEGPEKVNNFKIILKFVSGLCTMSI
jgi:hypothetical protein